MDYQGNYFPEEHDENESKVFRNVKRIFKWSMYGISFIVYGILIFLLFINRDSDILETNYMTDVRGMSDVDGNDIDLYRINTRIFMNELGSLQLYNVDYAHEYGLIEIGVKFNVNKLLNPDHDERVDAFLNNNESYDTGLDYFISSDEDYTNALDYILTDSNGNTYKLVNKVNDSGGKYGFARICFEGISLDLKSNDLKYNGALVNAVTPVTSDASQLWQRSDVKYTLTVVNRLNNTTLYEFILYDNSTVFNSTEYND